MDDDRRPSTTEGAASPRDRGDDIGIWTLVVIVAAGLLIIGVGGVVAFLVSQVVPAQFPVAIASAVTALPIWFAVSELWDATREDDADPPVLLPLAGTALWVAAAFALSTAVSEGFAFGVIVGCVAVALFLGAKAFGHRRGIRREEIRKANRDVIIVQKWAEQAASDPEFAGMLHDVGWRADLPDARTRYLQVWEAYKGGRRASGLTIWSSSDRHKRPDPIPIPENGHPEDVSSGAFPGGAQRE